ncbi:ATP synthase subunit I [Lonepinella sp. BR2919]|uniref:ATP synthase subunit I n=1 Tax=Lonepinella sp. BR2919 TaxID=3434552 RepID=UPI003A798C27
MMSAVLQQAQKLYKKVYIIEFVILIIAFFILSLFDTPLAYAFSIGYLVIFISSAIVIYFAFFYAKKRAEPIKITLFYSLEAIKFLFAILLIVISIKYLVVNNVFTFFIGFFIALALNSLLPFILNIFKQRN